MEISEIEGTPEEAIDLAHALYQALDTIMWRASQLPQNESGPASMAMSLYEAWEAKRQEKWQQRLRE